MMLPPVNVSRMIKACVMVLRAIGSTSMNLYLNVRYVMNSAEHVREDLANALPVGISKLTT